MFFSGNEMPTLDEISGVGVSGRRPKFQWKTALPMFPALYTVILRRIKKMGVFGPTKGCPRRPVLVLVPAPPRLP